MTPLRMGRPLGLFLAAVLAGGCGGGGGGGGGDQPTGPMTVSGTVTYDFVPATYDPGTGAGGLGFDAAEPRPVRNAVVQAVRGSTVLATTTTDASGAYTLSFESPSSRDLGIVALARTTDPVIAVRDNTDGNAVWAIGDAITASTTTLDLHAGHGWTGTTYNASLRAAAPFAVLDSMYTAARAFEDARPGVPYPPLNVFWSPNNVPQQGTKALGQIGTSHYAPNEGAIYILGRVGVDTDEFDNHVIVHEWGHYFESKLSRSDSPGGPHSAGDILDPRIAFGEGYGNALAAMLLPEPVYTDTLWDSGSIVAFGFDAETAPPPSQSSGGNPADDPSPSVFSETSIMRLLFDLYDDDANESFDGVAIGLGGVYDILTGAQKTTQALTTIGPFATAARSTSGVNGTALDTLLAHYNIGAITSDFGAGDTNLSSMYTTVAGPLTATAVNASIVLGGAVGSHYNKWFQNQYYVVTGTGRNVIVTAGSPTVTQASPQGVDVGLRVYPGYPSVPNSEADVLGSTTSAETLTFATTAGATYVVSLFGFEESAAEYTVNLTFRSP